ncbi:MAG TPA: toll/interleukin-1 receptor domain-containing protein, partial [Methylobacter sp.]|jgi:hypothetical protein
MADSSAFISYHHDDKIIGEALSEQFYFLASKGEGKRALSAFLDAKDIPAGQAWKPIIDTGLREKDWLIVIFTGDQSVYCGYEIGTFSQLHMGSPDRRIMGLYDVPDDKLPIVLKDNQNTPIPILDRVLVPKDVTVSTEEVNFWFHSTLGKFLKDFCNYKCLYTVGHEKDDPSAYNSNIALAAKHIANAFGLARGNDVKNETPSQITFEITVKGVGEKKLDNIPDEASVVGTSVFFATLGLVLPVSWDQAPNTTWGKLNELLQGESKKPIPWLHKVESDIVRALNSRALTGDDVTFRVDSGKVFRAILVRHKLFINGDRRFYLLLVESIDRRFAGIPRSSLLLTAIILASRWRFSYFENWMETVDRVFGEATSLRDFADSCKQLLYNIDWIEVEAVELGTSNMKAMVNAFGPDMRARVERFFDDWEKSKEDLSVFLPGLDVKITDDNRQQIRNGVMAFLNNTRDQNQNFLELALQTYTDEVKGKGAANPPH